MRDRGHLHLRRGLRDHCHSTNTQQGVIGAQRLLVPEPRITGMMWVMGDKEITGATGRGDGKPRDG